MGIPSSAVLALSDRPVAAFLERRILRVAEFLAARGPNDAGPENAVMREYGAHLHVRSDALTDAFATLIDERKLSETERLVTIAAIKEASGRVNEEYDKFREEQGLRD